MAPESPDLRPATRSADPVRAAQGSAEDERLFADLYRGLLKIARHDLREDAEDLVQTAVMRVLREVRRGTRIESVAAYAHTVYRHALADARRESGRHRGAMRIEPDAPLPAPDADRPDRRAEQRDRWRLVEESLRRVSRKQREILLLREREGRSYEEIGGILGLPMGTVASRLSEARSALVRAARRLQGKQTTFLRVARQSRGPIRRTETPPWEERKGSSCHGEDRTQQRRDIQGNAGRAGPGVPSRETEP